MGEGLLLARPVCGVGSEGSGLCQVEPIARGLLFILKKNQEKNWRHLGVGAGSGQVS